MAKVDGRDQASVASNEYDLNITPTKDEENKEQGQRMQQQQQQLWPATSSAVAASLVATRTVTIDRERAVDREQSDE
eukprot:5901-Prymnesium_polylepis.1